MDTSSKILGFKLLPVKYSEKSKAHQYLYIKQHQVREVTECKPTDRTIFILNVPPYCNKISLARIFNKCGKVEKVFLHSKPTGGEAEKQDPFFPTELPIKGYKVAYVVFKDAGGMKAALKMKPDSPCVLSSEKHPLLVGIKKWCSEYNKSLKPEQELQASIDDYMAVYDKDISEKQLEEKERTGVPDKDGWITVTKFGAKKGVSWSEDMQNAVMDGVQKKQVKKELKNFYRYQIKESKMEHIAQLREKFERDKQRIALMKAARKFKPY